MKNVSKNFCLRNVLEFFETPTLNTKAFIENLYPYTMDKLTRKFYSLLVYLMSLYFPRLVGAKKDYYNITVLDNISEITSLTRHGIKFV